MSKVKHIEDYDFGYSIALFTIKYPTWLFPLSIAVILFPVCFSAYISSVLSEKVSVFMPFISECVTRYPEAGYVTQFIYWISLICKFNIQYKL